jgi:hypothetical protein
MAKDKTSDAQLQEQQPEPPRRLDCTVPGGRYLVNGQYMNANGEPLPADPVPDASPALAQQSGG